MKYILLLVLALTCISSVLCQRRRPGARPNRRCMNQQAQSPVQIHMHTGQSEMGPVHQGTSDDTHIHVHVETGGGQSHAPEHESDGYMYAHATMASHGGYSIEGVMHLRQRMMPFMGPIEVMTELTGFDPDESHEHAVHIHEHGILDFAQGCDSTGGHYNPGGAEHVHDGSGHVGDWGNIACDDDGDSEVMFNNTHTSLHGPHCVMGRTIVIHAHADGADSSGGAKIACGVIVHAGAHAWPASAEHTGHSDEPSGQGHHHHGGRRRGHHGH